MLLLKRLILPLITVLVGFFCCHSATKNQGRFVSSAFYYWKQSPYGWNEDEGEYSPSKDLDTAYIARLGNRVYVKFFDIDWRAGNGAYPRQAFEQAAVCRNLEIVPVFYVLNRVFEKADSMDLENLAERLTKIVGEKYPEIQLDCDWTATTRDRYFQCLKILRRRLQPAVKLSATIRLHQIKYREKTGIPPVDRGMLMVYNVGNPTQFNEKNSILDLAEVRKYLDGQQTYPLQLDVALPIFRWGIAYRGEKLMTVFNDFNTIQADSTRFLTKKGRFYEVNADTVYRKTYLRFGDKIKIEEIDDGLLKECAEIAAPHVQHTDKLHIAYFHYEKSLIESLKPETYEQVFKIFNR